MALSVTSAATTTGTGLDEARTKTEARTSDSNDLSSDSFSEHSNAKKYSSTWTTQPRWNSVGRQVNEARSRCRFLLTPSPLRE